MKYPIVSFKSTFYIYGSDSGPDDTTPTKTVATFSTITRTWEQSGELNQARYNHRVSILRGEFIVVGGNQEQMTERCTRNDVKIQCTDVEPSLKNYVSSPEMMRVSDGYCPLLSTLNSP